MESAAAKIKMSDMDLVEMISAEMEDLTGIKLGESQSKMVLARLAKRMRTLEISNAQEYWSYLRANESKEIPKLISLLTTHHTFFFREFPQFEYLANTALPALVSQLKKEGRNHLRIWSAGCSRGEEVYSLSIFLNHHLKRIAPGFTYEILGSDICTESIAIAKNGVYHWDSIKEIPAMYLDGHWVKGRGSVADYAKIKPDIKAPCTFKIINLKSINVALEKVTFDLIFCRNVFIYFIAQRVQSIVNDMIKHLNPSGLLFLGMTENLIGLDLPVSHIGPSVYGLTETPNIVVPPPPSPEAIPANRLRILCVDDSPSVLKLLRHILSPLSGFEIVGTAGNGIEAAKFLQTHKVDLVTLDIHMPEQNGIEYLKQNFNPSHPPVVMVSTVAREDADLAHKALELGAIDYIEKPALDGLAQRVDEIRAKLFCAYEAHKSNIHVHEKIDHSFEKNLKLQNIEMKLRVIIAGPGQLREVHYILNELKGAQPPVALLLNGPENLLDTLISKVRPQSMKAVNLDRSLHESLEDDTVYVGQFVRDFTWLKDRNPDLQVSIMALDILDASGLARVRAWPNAHLIVQDLADLKVEAYKKMRQRANEIVPYTTFAYASDMFFNRKYVQDGLRSVVNLKPLEPSIFENSEVIRLVSHRDAIVCLFHTRKNTGAAVMIPEAILNQDSLLLEQTLKKLVMLTAAHSDNLKAKVVGSATVLRKIIEVLTEQKIFISFARELSVNEMEAYFFTDSGRLRLPRNLSGPPVHSPEISPSNRKKTRVLIVDDSKVIREMLRRMIEEDGSFEVVGVADRPSVVAEMIERLMPDVITLDIEMPEMSGVELLKDIMPRYAIPTVMISAIGVEEGTLVIQALELGAVDYIQKPEFSQIPALAPLIREKIRIASTITPRKAKDHEPRSLTISSPIIDQRMVIAIGASTGGTAAIKDLLSYFPENIPPVVIAQHIPASFSTAFAKRLDKLLPFHVKEAEQGDLLKSGRVLVAPGGMQMQVINHHGELKVALHEAEATELHKPSVDILFHSVARAAGSNAIGILLTGMGRDGAEGLLAMRKDGAHTFAQDRDHCIVFGMPKAAIEIGAAEYVQSLDHIPKTVVALLSGKNPGGKHA